MVRTLARFTTGPSGIAQWVARPPAGAVRPSAKLALRAAPALALALALSFAAAPEGTGAEWSVPPPGAATPFELNLGRELPGPSSEARPRPAQLALVFFDPQGLLPRGFDVFAAEVQAIFRGLGVESSWRVGGTYGESPLPEVPVIVLARDPLKRRGPTRVMGLVIRDQEPQRAVWLFMEGVRFSLGYPTGADAGDLGKVARALARVAAHEIVHAVAPDEPHAAEGLMRHSLDRKFLLGSRAIIDARCAASFRARLFAEGKVVLARASSAPRAQPVVP